MHDDLAAYHVYFQIELDEPMDVPEARIALAIRRLLRDELVEPGAELSFVVTGDDQIRDMNRQYRGVDAPTDVLSFPCEPDPGAVEDAAYLGDLLVSLPYVARQAAAEGHAVSDELVLVAVHGTLHLLGYDHDTPENQAAMWAVQAQALKKAGVSIEVPLFSFDSDEDDGAAHDEPG